MRTLVLAMLLIAAPLVAIAPTAEAAPDCYSVYNKWVVGPVTVVQRSSCDYDVYVDREGLLP